MTFTTLAQKFAIATGAIAAASFVAAAPAQALSIGDIQITGYQSQTKDSFSFVTWADIVAGAGLTFVDNGFTSTGWRTGETPTTWSNTTGSVIAAGTVINISGNTSGNTAGAGADLGTGSSPAFATEGDQIFVVDGVRTAAQLAALFTGTSPNATLNGSLLYGFDYSGAAGWNDTAATLNSNNSVLPSVLNVDNGNTAFAAGSSVGIEYTGSRSGKTIAEYRALLSDIANWTAVTGTSTGGVSGGVTSTDFAIVPAEAVPTPALLPALIGFGASIVRKRKQEETV
jgi:hypothetical protein